MQETEFIRQNKDKWHELETVLRSPSKDPDRLTNLFIESTDDLSYSRTYYPNRSVRVYLNDLAQQVFQTIYKNKRREKKRFSAFWLNELPDAMWYARRQLLWSFVIFLTGIASGILSSVANPEFASVVLSAGYVAQTEENIASNDPMAVYKSMQPFQMFLYIAWNNIQVTMLVFILGILFGIGTIYQLFFEGIRLGAFMYFFYERDLFSDAFFAVMLHGTLELSMVVLAGTAGLVIGKGLMFPGTYSRLQSLMLAARHAFRIFIAVALVLVLAAFIESFATRHTEMPNVLRGTIIGLSFLFVLSYFVIYPWYRHRKGKTIPELTDEPAPERKIEISYHLIKTNGKIFTEIFHYFAQHYRGIIIASLICVASALPVYYVVSNYQLWTLRPEAFPEFFVFAMLWDFLWVWNDIEPFFRYAWPPILGGYHTLCLSALLTLYSAYFCRSVNGRGFGAGAFFLQGFNNTLIAAGITALVVLPAFFALVLSVFIMPLLFFLSSVCACEQRAVFSAIGRMFRLVRGNYWKLIGNFMFTFGLQWITLLFLFSPFRWLVERAIGLSVDDGLSRTFNVYDLLNIAITFGIMASLLSLTVFSFHSFYYSSVETNEAPHLRSLISKIGFKRRAYGLEKEV